MNTIKKLIILPALLLMNSATNASVISATYVQQTGPVLVDFDTLQIGGNEISDWMIFDDSSANNIHDRKLGGQLIVNPASSAPTTPYNSYSFSWSDGTFGTGTGTNELGLGYSINGSAEFAVNVAPESQGIYRVYVEAGANEQTFYSANLAQTINIAKGTHGYIDIEYDNTSTSATALRLLSTFNSNSTSMYAIAVSQIPEPAVASFIALVGIGSLFIKRRLSA